ncbi:unnamed protein product [Pleuronectes platessa]|uniref:Uncharacterized protein n=1 Tax=Pleuronectes platessa TaxID=8262 RepID=A0A9N7YZH7_PLEPL|nr:unnamed protein product [Pleuronectes platessa]
MSVLPFHHLMVEVLASPSPLVDPLSGEETAGDKEAEPEPSHHRSACENATCLNRQREREKGRGRASEDAAKGEERGDREWRESEVRRGHKDRGGGGAREAEGEHEAVCHESHQCRHVCDAMLPSTRRPHPYLTMRIALKQQQSA